MNRYGGDRAGGSVAHVLAAHIDTIAQIASALEPDWSVVNRQVDLHNWCGETCSLVRAVLACFAIPATLVRGELRGCTHAWLVLCDGSILDPTVSQFDPPGGEYEVDTDTEVHWLTSATGRKIALIEPGAPLHRDYHRRVPARHAH